MRKSPRQPGCLGLKFHYHLLSNIFHWAWWIAGLQGKQCIVVWRRQCLWSMSLPAAHLCSPLPALVINPVSAPPLTILLLPCLGLSTLPLSSQPLKSLPSWNDRTIYDGSRAPAPHQHWFDLSADGEPLIKGVNQQNAKGETVVQLPDSALFWHMTQLQHMHVYILSMLYILKSAKLIFVSNY